MTTTQAIVDRAAALGIRAKLWQKGDRLRIYAQTDRRDMSVYLELDGIPERVDGAAMKVFCNTEQHPNWIKSQVAQFKDAYIALFHAYVVEMYRDTGPQPNGYGVDINDMIDESRAFVAAHEAQKAEDDAD